MTAGVFPADHEIEVLRGRSTLEPVEVRRELKVRVAWLKHRVEVQKIDNKPPGRELRELKALAFLNQLLDDAYPEAEDTDTEPPPAPGGDAA